MCNICQSRANVGRPAVQPAQRATNAQPATVRGRAIVAQQAATVRSNSPYMGRPKIFNNNPILR